MVENFIFNVLEVDPLNCISFLLRLISEEVSKFLRFIAFHYKALLVEKLDHSDEFSLVNSVLTFMAFRVKS